MMSISRTLTRGGFLAGATVATLGIVTPAIAQIAFEGGPGANAVLCGGRVQFANAGDCDDSDTNATALTFGNPLTPGFAGIIFRENGTADFNNTTVQFNSSNVAFGGGNTSFNSTVTFTGPSATFDTNTTFNNVVDFNGTITTAGITNTGAISSTTLTGSTVNATTALNATAGAAINMGGNQVHGVAAGTANTDAVNVAQLNAATAGVAADVTALETLTDTHTHYTNH